MQPEDLERLKKFVNKDRIKGLRQPLEGALLATPLILLAPVSVSSGRYSQPNLLNVSEGYDHTFDTDYR